MNDRYFWEELKWGILLAICIVCVTVISIVGIREHTIRIKTFVSNGFTRQTLVGTSETQWVKVVK